MDIAIILLILAAMIGLFKWLFQTITEEKIDWWDSATFVVLAGLIRRLMRFLDAKIDAFPDFMTTWGSFAIYILLFYWLLRVWKGTSKRQAGMLVAIWIPISFVIGVAMVIVFLD
ncbi:MAG: hypothetical protein R3B67_02175 [Phycisphaerales bacterium]